MLVDQVRDESRFYNGWNVVRMPGAFNALVRFICSEAIHRVPDSLDASSLLDRILRSP